MSSRWLKPRHLGHPLTLRFMWGFQDVHILALTHPTASCIFAPCRSSSNLTLCRASTITLVSVGVFDSFRTNTSVLPLSGSHQCSCMVATRPIAAGKAYTLHSRHPLSSLQIPFSGDFRPYFTIHDTEKQVLINKLQPPPGLILGTTNPFVYEECRHWPHTLSLGWGDAM